MSDNGAVLGDACDGGVHVVGLSEVRAAIAAWEAECAEWIEVRAGA